MIIPDANILIYAYNEASAEMKSAREWLLTSLSTSVEIGFGWQTLTAFIRISTDKRIFPQSYSVSEAFEIVEHWISAPMARILVPTANHLLSRKLRFQLKFLQSQKILLQLCQWNGGVKIHADSISPHSNHSNPPIRRMSHFRYENIPTQACEHHWQ